MHESEKECVWVWVGGMFAFVVVYVCMFVRVCVSKYGWMCGWMCVYV